MKIMRLSVIVLLVGVFAGLCGVAGVYLGVKHVPEIRTTLRAPPGPQESQAHKGRGDHRDRKASLGRKVNLARLAMTEPPAQSRRCRRRPTTPTSPTISSCLGSRQRLVSGVTTTLDGRTIPTYVELCMGSW